MKVEIHKLFSYLLETTQEAPEAVVGLSLSSPPTLGAFLDDLDPELSLDWNQRSFRGLPELRQHVLRQASLEDECKPDDVLITAGAAEANYLALRQLLQPGDEMILESPGWPQAVVLGKAIGVKMHVLRRREKDAWRFSIDELAELINEKTRLIFLTNPNNPTGQVLSAEELSQIVVLAERVGAYLLVDEVYAGLEWETHRAPSIAALYDRGITTGSVSKTLGLQGLRTGWMICRDPRLLMDALILRENSSEIMNILGEVVAEIALRPERYAAAIADGREEGQANLRRLDAFVTEAPRLSWRRPRAGLIGLARLADGIDGEDFARRLLAPPYRTFLIPGSAYQEPHHIRLGVGGGAQVELGTGLSRVAALLKAWA